MAPTDFTCEIDVLGCQLHGIIDYINETGDEWFWGHCCFGYGKKDEEMRKLILSWKTQEPAIWAALAKKTGCKVRASRTTLAIGLRHTCVRGGLEVNGQCLRYPAREIYDPDGSVTTTPEILPPE